MRVAIELVALEAIMNIEIPEMLRPGVEAGKAAVGAEPEEAVIVLENRVDNRGGQAMSFVVTGEGQGGRVKAIQAAAVSARPDQALAIDKDTYDRVRA